MKCNAAFDKTACKTTFGSITLAVAYVIASLTHYENHNIDPSIFFFLKAKAKLMQHDQHV